MFYDKTSKAVSNWLFFIVFMVFLMVVVGGITRLTESGLSMVNWQPVLGIFPPFTEAEWLAEFANYKESPQYKLVNHGMSLAEFQGIYWWEWFHRLLGRLIGIVFFIPMLWFWWRGTIPKGYKGHLVFLFILGGLQGLLGWYMVKSGLVDEPAVSHLRLTAHLSLALFIIAYAYWTALSVRGSSKVNTTRGFKRLTHITMLILTIQLALGGLFAGLRAGYIYNTWPLMGDSFVPNPLFDIEPWYSSLINSATTVQFDHRIGAYMLTFLSLLTAWKAYRNRLAAKIQRASYTLAILVLIQASIGVLTLLKSVPVSWGAMHQAGGVFVLLAMIRLLYIQKRT